MSICTSAQVAPLISIDGVSTILPDFDSTFVPPAPPSLPPSPNIS